MSMAGMGLMGLVAGGSTAAVMGVVRLMGDTWLPRMAASSEHKHEMIANLQQHRHETVRQWRAGLANARDAYRQWEAGSHDHVAPNAVGDEWFEGLRPHLPATGEAAKFRTAHELHCDNATVALLSLEIGRVERQWVAEAKSYPRRAKN
jgi:hypothetical protein